MSQNPYALPPDIKRIFLSLALIIVPPIPEINLDGIEDKFIRDASRLIFAMPKLFRWGFLMGIRFFEWLPVIFGFGLARFSELSLETQGNYAENWAGSRLLAKREFFKTLKAFILLIYFSDKRIWSYLGYKQESHMQERIQMRENFLSQQQQ